MVKLTDGQKEQARSMFKEDKRCNEIIDFFKKTYNITLLSSTLSYILHGKKKSAKLGPKAKNTHKYTKRAPLPLKPEPIPIETSDEFVFHVRASFAAFKKMYLKQVEAVISPEK